MKQLVACLALQSNERDKAIGINWPSRRTAGLLWYYNELDRADVARVATAAYLNNEIQKGLSQAKMWLARAEGAKDKHKIARKVVTIQEKVSQAKKQLEALNGSE